MRLSSRAARGEAQENKKAKKGAREKAGGEMADIERVFVFCLPGGRGGGRMAAKGWMVVAYEFGGQLANGTGRVEVEREDVSGWSRSGRRGGWGADGLGGERGLVVNPDGHTTSMPERCGGGERCRKAVGEGREMGVGW